MKCLTICQPYAELIASGQKLIENRTWPTNYRGPLLIHAGKSRKWLCTYSPLPKRMEFGAIVAVVRLVTCLPLKDVIHDDSLMHDVRYRHYVEGPYCWVLSDVRRLKVSIPYRGLQGLFSVPLEENDA